MAGAGLQQVDRAALERLGAEADGAVDEIDVVGAEFLEEFVELDQCLGHDIAVAVIILRVVDIGHGQAAAVEIMDLEHVPEIEGQAQQQLEAR